MARLFYALWPDSGARIALHRAALKIDVRDARRVAADRLHITLVFLGEVAPEQSAELIDDSAAIRAAAFALEFWTTGWWRGARVAWLAPVETPTALLQLVADLRRRSTAGDGLEDDGKRYQPYVTIARRVRRAPRAAGAIRLRWQVHDFALVRSVMDPAGARYEVLRRWPLAAAAGN